MLIVTGPLTARLLGPAGRGDLAVLQLWPLLVTEIASIGIPSGITYAFASDDGYSPNLMRQSRQVMCVSFTAASILVVITVVILRPSLAQPTTLGAAIGIIWAGGFYRLGLSVLQGVGDLASFNILRVLPMACYLGFVTAVFIAELNDVTVLAWCWAGSLVLGAIVTTILAHRTARLKRQTHAGTDLKTTVAFGLRGHLSSLSPVDGLKLDQIIGTAIFNAPSLGIYVVASAFSNLPKILTQSIGMIAFPSLATDKDPSIRNQRAVKYVLRTGALIVAVVALGIVLVPYCLPLFFGVEFTDAVLAGQVLVVVGGLAAFRKIVTECLRGLDQPGATSAAELALIVGLLVGVWFVGGGLTPMNLSVVLLVSQLPSLATVVVLWWRRVK